MALFNIMLLTVFKRCKGMSVAEIKPSPKNIYNVVFKDWAHTHPLYISHDNRVLPRGCSVSQIQNWDTLEILRSLFTRNCYNIGLQPDLTLTSIHSPKETQGEIQNLPIYSRHLSRCLQSEKRDRP